MSESGGGSQEAKLQLSTASVSGPYLKCLEHIGSTVLNFHVPLIIRMSYVLLAVSQLYYDSEIEFPHHCNEVKHHGNALPHVLAEKCLLWLAPL